MEPKQIFAFLEPEEEAALLAAAPTKLVSAGDVVLDQNVVQQAIFVIDSGSVRVERLEGHLAIELAILARGEFFGELSFVDGAATSARVVAREVTQVRIIDAAVVKTQSDADPNFAVRLYRSIAAILAERLRTTSLNVYV
jgi:CRP-like cAMP-binding protein